MQGVSSAAPKADLKRGVGLVAATGSGIAIIVGAGVYVLMGEAAGRAGNALWLSVILAGGAALLTALSYAELSSMFPLAASGYNYAKRAFGEGTAFVVGWLTLFSQVVSVSAVALGFGAYLQDSTGLAALPSAALLILACGTVAYQGIKESTVLGALLSLLEVGGLVVIGVVGFTYWGHVNYLELPHGVTGIFAGASLLFFAFLGFEQVADLAQEIRNPTRNVPWAILLSGGVSAALYILAGVSAVSILGWAALSSSEAPLTSVAQAALGSTGARALSAIALVSTASTALIIVVATTRTLYGMAAGGSLPGLLAKVGAKRQTPWVATLIVLAVALMGTLTRDISLVATIANTTLLLVFVAVNLALIALRRSEPAERRPFRVPFAIKGVPVTAALGIVASVFMIAMGGVAPALYGLLVAGVGVGIVLVRNRRRRETGP